MPGPQFRFFIKIIICQFEKELAMSGSESARSQDEMKQTPGNALRSKKQKAGRVLR